MQGDGNLVEYDGATAAWASGSNVAGSTAVLQGDGNFVVYSGATAKWASNTSGTPNAYLVLGDSGILSVDSPSGIELWGAVGTVIPGAELGVGQQITSPNHTYRLLMQGDGNLVEYDGATVIWASGTKTAGSIAVMQSDGNLVVYSGATALWASNTYGYPGAYLALSDTGVLSVNGSAGTALWG